MVSWVSDIPDAPKAIGPYSPAVLSGALAFLSGQIPIVPSTGVLVSGGIREQTEQVMKNISAVLKHLGLGFNSVLKVTIFLTDLREFKSVNEVYSQWMGESKPARSTVQVAALPLGALVEIELIASTEGLRHGGT